MSYWVREVAGWLLVAVGLYAFYQAYGLLLDRRVFEAGPVTFMGFIIFRGGVHVLKVAVAAQMARGVTAAAKPTARRPPRPPGRPLGPTPASSIVPGPKPPPLPT